jgi:hypothetical protein
MVLWLKQTVNDHPTDERKVMINNEYQNEANIISKVFVQK